ncbi:glycosyltransferase family 4 protein [Achromobacter sp. GG226]|uniref:glycosyltransferase family 4 protein n=1 Tax=Verticiella alkaliphila TaxID=2779529 RepID=UPI001C0DD563|nr:glycosyltransferase family 1 protein [Verticiella sp. GG226]MBU4612102.1 glycosyltransferase family 4 protein [Verticiella sp. GG226]
MSWDDQSPPHDVPPAPEDPVVTETGPAPRGADDRLWIDVTASFHWRRAPSGITRVEQECVRWALDAVPDQVRFCLYDLDRQAWFSMPHDEARAVLARAYGPDGSAVAETVSDWAPAEPAITFAPGERYLCLSADQTPERIAALFDAHRQQGLRVFGIVYDLIQILFPHFYWRHADQGCARYLTDMAWMAEHLVCISARTRDDLLGFYDTVGVSAPPLSLVRLGDELPPAAQWPCSPEVQALVDAGTPFILVVGTLEIRKNHEVLYRALLHLLAQGVEDLPLLVFTGMRGWRIDDLLASIELDPRVQGRIRLISHASDADVAALYRHCRFTAFPSQYEGWGLPVAESLAYGRVCLAANAGSVPEIAPGLTDLIAPHDVQAWAQRMLAYSRDTALREAREREIVAGYRVTPWRETAAVIVRRALTGGG